VKRHVVLLHPEPGPKDTEHQILPLGVLHVAAPLVEDGWRVTALDQRKDPDWRATVRQLATDPDTVCVGISTMTGPQIGHALEMAEVVREAAPDVPLVWGGVHPSLLPEQTAEHPLVDIVAAGEGETIFPPLVEALSEGRDWRDLPGLCYRDDQGEVVRNPDGGIPELDDIPRLPYELFDLEKYKVSALRSGPSLPLVTSRGCRFRCAYCYIQDFFSRKWRGLSVRRTLDEFHRLVDEYDAAGVFLLDDFFFQDRKRAQGILQGLIDEKIEVDLYNANCRADFLYRSDDAFLELMRDAGIKTLFVGTEAGSDETLKLMLKDINTEQVLEVNRRLAKVGIRAVYSFMAGMPDESEENVMETLAFMAQLKAENPGAMLYSVNLFVPFPGTHYFKRAEELGCTFPESLAGWGSFDYGQVNLTYLTPEMRKFLERAEGVSAFLDVDGKTGALIAPFVRAYAAIARMRVKARAYSFMPELPFIRAARALR
jgi:anaerobic magnesium-protoporphyrin IX monomethyl ester cyclase